jgi:hypothetical protein
MRKPLTIGLCSVFIVCIFAMHSFAADAEKEAVKAAEEWMVLVDTGEYSKSWEEVAAPFKQAITREKWAEAIKSVRPPFGDVVQRNLKSAKYSKTLAGAPDGEYVVIQFLTEFTRKKEALETVTAMKDPDGKWRVGGYYIK